MSLSSLQMPFEVTQRSQRRRPTERRTVSWTRTVTLSRRRSWQGTVAAAMTTAVQPAIRLLHAGVCRPLRDWVLECRFASLHDVIAVLS